MSISKLKLNPDKTEFIFFGSNRQRDRLKECFPIDILGSPLCPAESKNVDIWFNSDFPFSKHVQSVSKVVLCNFLTYDTSILVAKALVSSRLDYGNSLFSSLFKFNL